MSERSDRLKSARLAAGFKSTEEVAKRLGMSASTYRAHENGQNDFDSGHATRYAQIFKTTPAFLTFGTDEPSADASLDYLREIPNARIGDKLPDRVKTIPLYGHAIGGQDGEFVLNGNKLDDIAAPPSISGIKGAYAVTVAGESMEPRYFDGETIFVDPHKRIAKGDFVVAQIQHPEDDGSPPLAYIKRFVRHNAAELVLEQYNPPKQLTFPHDHVVAVHYIVMGGRVT